MSTKTTGLIIILMLAFSATVTIAAEDYWINSSGGPFSTGGNWSSGSQPANADNAHFTNNATYTVTWSATASNSSAYFDAPGGTVNLNPGANAWQLGGDLNVGSAAGSAANMILSNGTYSINRILCTNVVNGAGTSFVTFDSGTVTTYGASIIMATNGFVNNTADFLIGGAVASAGTFMWNIAGGTNTVQSCANQAGWYQSEAGNSVDIGGVGRKAIVNVSGTNTVFEAIGGALCIGGGTASRAGGNQLNISGGAKVYNTNVMNSAQNVSYVGWGTSISNIITVTGSNSVLALNGLQLSKNSSTGAGNLLMVTNGGSVWIKNTCGIQDGENMGGKVIVTGTNSSLYAGALALSASGKNGEFRVENGGSSVIGGSVSFGSGANGISNAITITGAGSSFAMTGTVSDLNWAGGTNFFTVSAGATASLTIRNGGVSGIGTIAMVQDTNSVLTLSCARVYASSSLIVTNGGRLVMVPGVGGVEPGTTAGGVSRIIVTGSGSVWTNQGAAGNDTVRLGTVSGALGWITVDNGGNFNINPTGNSGIDMGHAAGGTGVIQVAGANSVFAYNGVGIVRVGSDGVVGHAAGVGQLIVSNKASFFSGTGSLTVGTAVGGTGSTVLASDGGLLDFNNAALTVGNFAGNTVSNIGGVFQFASASSVITPGAPDKVAVSGGTIAYRNIANADVRCSQSAYQLASDAKVSYTGNNTFRLNNASNTTSSQDYTFDTTHGSANFANLELYNGSLYRGGNVTIGSGGSLFVTNGTSTISGNLTLGSGSTYHVRLGSTGSYDRVAVGGTVTLGGTLDLQLTAPPVRGYFYTLIDVAGSSPASVSGSWSGTVNASYGGTNYVLSVLTGRGDGNNVVAAWLTRGTVVFVE